jgi:hypothetical protein
LFIDVPPFIVRQKDVYHKNFRKAKIAKCRTASSARVINKVLASDVFFGSA